jgi:hypothetical protein
MKKEAYKVLNISCLTEREKTRSEYKTTMKISGMDIPFSIPEKYSTVYLLKGEAFKKLNQIKNE